MWFSASAPSAFAANFVVTAPSLPRLSSPLLAALLLSFFTCIASAQNPNRPPYASSSSSVSPSGPEKDLFDAANRERAAEDLPPLRWDASLAAAARQHALRMSEERLVEHEYSGEPSLRDRTAASGAHFSVVAENIAVAKDTVIIHMSWMHSPGHRHNILDPQLTSIGIAVVDRRGYLFAVQDFSLAVEALTLDQQEQRVADELRASGFTAVVGTSDARKACALDDGHSGNALTYLRFETSDLTHLPASVTARLASVEHHFAAVGACTAKTTGFTRYRIAILFFADSRSVGSLGGSFPAQH